MFVQKCRRYKEFENFLSLNDICVYASSEDLLCVLTELYVATPVSMFCSVLPVNILYLLW